MNFEADLQSLLVSRCSKVFHVVAPAAQTQSYVVWQEIGGRSLRYFANDAMDKRNTLLQVSVWAQKAGDCRDLIRLMEDDLCTTSAFVAEPQGEPLAQYDEETKWFGAIQRFSITAPRN